MFSSFSVTKLLQERRRRFREKKLSSDVKFALRMTFGDGETFVITSAEGGRPSNFSYSIFSICHIKTCMDKILRESAWV
jgi:hypothetical protein